MTRALVARALAVAALCAVAAAQQTDARPTRPNFVVIVSDDAGYADFSCQGSRQIATPRIDSIAQSGVRFTNGYVSGTVCSPSRAGLMTGRYQQRFGHETNIPPRPSETNGLPLEERTFADLLRAAGYRTIGLGKWHLGYADHFHPTARGFDDWFGFLQGARSYRPLEAPTVRNRLQRGTATVPEAFDYLTDELGRQAAEYIAANKSRPFFLYLAFNAVHTPMHALEQDLEGVTAPQPRRQKLIAMTRALDRAVGVVLDALAEHGLRDDTLVVFVNDNGGATNNASRNGPLRGRKGQVWEGGIRVPFLLQWPARVAAGRVSDEPVIALDILPTCLLACGAEPPVDDARPLDGRSLLPHLCEPAAGPVHDALYWRHGDRWAVRVGDHKLVRQLVDAPPQLFDLRADPGEAADLAAAQPERVAALQRRYDEWAAQLVAPRW